MMDAQKELTIVKESFSKGYKLGKLIPESDYHFLQKKFQFKALDKDSQHYQRFRAMSLGYDTALRERGLILDKPKKLESLKKLIDNMMPNVWEDKWIKKGKDKDNEMEIDF